jgi:hypothetical protein
MTQTILDGPVAKPEAGPLFAPAMDSRRATELAVAYVKDHPSEDLGQAIRMLLVEIKGYRRREPELLEILDRIGEKLDRAVAPGEVHG